MTSPFVLPRDPHAWIDDLPERLSLQARALRGLFDALRDDERVRAFRVRGSLARGTADRYSDVDVKVWVRDADYPAFLDDLPAIVRTVGPTLDILFETPGSPFLFVQFDDGVQLELSTGPAGEAAGRDQGVVLLDRDGIFQLAPDEARPWDQDLWLGWAWMSLSSVDKYLRRASLWEALAALERARTMLLRHHAAVLGLRDPQYGLASILDHGGTLPLDLEATVTTLDAAAIRRAAQTCGRLLTAYGERPFTTLVLQRLSEDSTDSHTASAAT